MYSQYRGLSFSQAGVLESYGKAQMRGEDTAPARVCLLVRAEACAFQELTWMWTQTPKTSGEIPLTLLVCSPVFGDSEDHPQAILNLKSAFGPCIGLRLPLRKDGFYFSSGV